MNSIAIRVAIALIAVAAFSTQRVGKPPASPPARSPESPAITSAVAKGAAWLASTQGADGGWGQDGDGSTNRTQQNLESQGNDIANTAVAALALLRAGKQYQANVERAADFILRRIESSPNEGLAITDQKGTQIQRKLGPYIDTFLASMLLAKMDGTLAHSKQNSRVHLALEKCVAKIEKNQAKDGSWNAGGGWAPVLGTSMASQSLFEAERKGVVVNQAVKDKAETYTANALNGRGETRIGTLSETVTVASSDGIGRGRGAGAEFGAARGTLSSSESAGVDLYQQAQAMEQLSRTDVSRTKNARELAKIRKNLGSAKFVEGFGSIGGEEFFSYLNMSDGMKRTGGEAWKNWYTQITDKIVKLQNSDGTWAGHHCITGRVAVTSAAILNLTVEREN